MTVLAFDFGRRFIGVAVGEDSLGIASPLTTIEAEASDARFAAIAALIEQWRPSLLVVGLPLSMDGEAHDLTRRARRFSRQLEGRFHMPTRLVDERLTSAEAVSELSRLGRGGRANKNLIHPVAAQLILQDYFDRADRPDVAALRAA